MKEGGEMTDIERLRREVAYSTKVDLENLLLKRNVENLLAALEQLATVGRFEETIKTADGEEDPWGVIKAMRNALEAIKKAKGAD
jgi:hypothetical protein